MDMGAGYAGSNGNGEYDGSVRYGRFRQWVIACERGQRVMLFVGVLGLMAVSIVACWRAATIKASARARVAAYTESAQEADSSVHALLARGSGRVSPGDSAVLLVAGVPDSAAHWSQQRDRYQRLARASEAQERRAAWGLWAAIVSALFAVATGWLLLWLWLGAELRARPPVRLVGWPPDAGIGSPSGSRELAQGSSPGPPSGDRAGVARNAIRTASAGGARRPFTVRVQLEGESRLRLRVPVATLSGAEARRLRDRLRPLMQVLDARAVDGPATRAARSAAMSAPRMAGTSDAPAADPDPTPVLRDGGYGVMPRSARDVVLVREVRRLDRADAPV